MRLPLFVGLLAVAACTSDPPDDDTGPGSDADTEADTEVSDVDDDGFTVAQGDCDDTDARVNPDAPERCNGEDDNCNGDIDENASQRWYVDSDNDGFGAEATDADCDGEAGLAARSGDCDDTNADAFPGATDTDRCDGVSQDCQTDELLVPSAFTTIDAAISAASNGDRVCVAPGTYDGSVTLNGKRISLIGVQGPDVTILDADGSGRVFIAQDDETRDSVLEGFTLTGGQNSSNAGGVDIFESSPTLRNLIITDNEGRLGGGISSRFGDPLIENVQVSNNVATTRGGGMELSGGEPVLNNVLISNNLAGLAGGLFADGADVVGTNVRIEENVADSSAGGMYLVGFADAVFTNLIVVDNESDDIGGIELNLLSATITNATISGNSGDTGGGVYVFGGDHTFTNTYFSYNEATTGGAVYIDPSQAGTLAFTYSNFYGNVPDRFGGSTFTDPVGSDGNISIEPDYNDPLGSPDGWDLRSDEGIDLGDPSITDPDGSRSNMGAYGGPGAGGFDIDGDGFFEWWQALSYTSTEANDGWDCNDRDASAVPGDGC